MRIYLAGPMRGYPNFNFPAFARAAEQLREQGHEVFNPGEEEITGLTFAEYMRKDIPEVLKADAVFVLKGWIYSEGAKVEVTLAQTLGIPVYRIYSNGWTEPLEKSIVVKHSVQTPYYFDLNLTGRTE